MDINGFIDQFTSTYLLRRCLAYDSGSISIRFDARMYLDSKITNMCICMYIYIYRETQNPANMI